MMRADNLRLLLTLAWRNLWRNPRRTAIVLLAVALGVWAMVVVGSFMRGWHDQVVENAVDTLTGYVQIRHEDYWDDPAIDNSLPAPSDELMAVLEGDSVSAWSARLRVPAMVSSERASARTTLVGMDPDAERGLSFIPDAISEGRYLESADDSSLILGERLAERLDTQPGRRVVLMSQNPDNQLVDRGFRVAGLYQARLEATEEAFVFTGQQTAQQLLETEALISEISLAPAAGVTPEELRDALREVVDEGEVRTWQEAQPLTVARLQLIEGIMYIWFVVVVIAMAFGITNSLIMAVTERAREFSLVQALGLGRRKVLGMVVSESLMVLAVGAVIGNLLAFLTVAAFPDGLDLTVVAGGGGGDLTGMGGVVDLVLSGEDLAAATGLVLILGVLASLYPAWWAMRRVPASSLNHQ